METNNTYYARILKPGSIRDGSLVDYLSKKEESKDELESVMKMINDHECVRTLINEHDLLEIKAKTPEEAEGIVKLIKESFKEITGMELNMGYNFDYSQIS